MDNKMKREEILDTAKKCVCGEQEILLRLQIEKG